ncbi:MAG: TonB-dependent receptor, partial [Phycisphaerae bacterium]|nr:TonB-dependent receptor [Phycisphaerae bacterium]
RFILFGERARDGDFALGDLAAVRSSPHRVSHDFEGFTERDIFSPTLILNHFGETLEFTSISGFAWWKTFDATDLDTTPVDLVVRRNDENLWQFTQEFRLATPQDAPVVLNDRVDLRWLLGTFLFYSDYDQDASNSLSAAAAAAIPVPFAFNDQSQADLDNMGLAVFGQATLTVDEKLDVILGARLDYEHKEATLDTFTTPITAPPVHEQFSEHFTEVSPRVGLAYHLTDDAMVYANWSRGFKAGGFNAVAPAGEAEIAEETSSTYEVGVKVQGWDDQLTVNAALFHIDWEDLQLDVPNLMVPGRFFVDNVGKARSSGFEVETNLQVRPGWDVFGGVGYLDTRFHSGSTTLGAPIGGNDLPFAPHTTWNVGTQFQQDLECCGLILYGRAEVTGYSGYFYEATNAANQDTFNLANFRLGVRKGNWNAEAWVRNAFDTDYVPLAFPFDPALTPSGFAGEAGAPVTYGVTVGIRF